MAQTYKYRYIFLITYVGGYQSAISVMERLQAWVDQYSHEVDYAMMSEKEKVSFLLIAQHIVQYSAV